MRDLHWREQKKTRGKDWKENRRGKNCMDESVKRKRIYLNKQ